jgi:CBS domain-containing protein
MTRNPHTVTEPMTISDLIHHMFAEKYLAYPVVDGTGNLTGFVTLQDVRKVRSEGHDESTLTVADIMSRQFDKIREHQTALDAFQRIGRSSSGRLLVVDSEGRLQGIISKTDLVRTVQVRMVERELDDSTGDSAQ